MKLPRYTEKDLEEEKMLSAGICPKCKGRVMLVLKTAKDGCWSETFICECGYVYPSTWICCEKHDKEVGEHGSIVSDVQEVSNREHHEFILESKDGREWKV